MMPFRYHSSNLLVIALKATQLLVQMKTLFLTAVPTALSDVFLTAAVKVTIKNNAISAMICPKT